MITVEKDAIKLNKNITDTYVCMYCMHIHIFYMEAWFFCRLDKIYRKKASSIGSYKIDFVTFL